jgi:phospho-N-acetylmuramoyl-pentapeptide-transferase
MTQTLDISIHLSTLINMLGFGFVAFVIAMGITPIYTGIAYKYQWWKKARSDAWSGGKAAVYNKLHATKHLRNIPTMAGLIFILTIALVTLFGNLSRGETWVPLAALLASGAVGLVDDVFNIRGTNKAVGGMRAAVKFGLQSLIALVVGWWLFAKLGINSVAIPGLESVYIGVLIIALFWLVVVATANSVNITDGLDGLAGGLLVTSFATYAIIAVVEGKYSLAAFCLTIVGALLSYTWFNIYPARFFMGDVGAVALGTTLGVIAIQTDTIFILPIIGAVYVMETGSVIINRLSRKFRNGKRVFLSSPLHHHFEALGWPETKVTMRFWILGNVAAVVGLITFFIGRYQ